MRNKKTVTTNENSKKEPIHMPGHNDTHSRRGPIVFGIVALTVATVTTVPLIAGADSAPTTPTRAPAGAMQAASPGAHVSLLERGSTASAVITPELEKLRDKAADGGKGPATLNNLSAAVRVPSSSADQSLAVVDDQNGTCLLLTGKYGSSFGCGPGLEKVPMLGALDVVDANHWRVAFVLPDGVETFNIALQDGTTEAVPVKENVIDTIVAGGGPTTFTWREANGEERTIPAGTPKAP